MAEDVTLREAVVELDKQERRRQNVDNETYTGRFIEKTEALIDGFDIDTALGLTAAEHTRFVRDLTHHIAGRAYSAYKKLGLEQTRGKYLIKAIGQSMDPEKPKSSDTLINNSYVYRDGIYHAAGEFAEFLFPNLQKAVSNDGNTNTQGYVLFNGVFNHNESYPQDLRREEFERFQSTDVEKGGKGFNGYAKRFADDREKPMNKHAYSIDY